VVADGDAGARDQILNRGEQGALPGLHELAKCDREIAEEASRIALCDFEQSFDRQGVTGKLAGKGMEEIREDLVIRQKTVSIPGKGLEVGEEAVDVGREELHEVHENGLEEPTLGILHRPG
jgi:hypothetical protein